MQSKQKINCIIRIPEAKASVDETGSLCAKIFVTLYKWHQVHNLQEKNISE